MHIVTSDEQVAVLSNHLTGRSHFLAFLEDHVEAAIEADEGTAILAAVVEHDLHCAALDGLQKVLRVLLVVA